MAIHFKITIEYTAEEIDIKPQSQQSEEKVKISDHVLRLLLDYEAAERRHEFLKNQLQTLEK